MPSMHATLTAAALGDELTENEASVRVFLTAGGLAVLGLALTLFTVWWWRSTKPEPPALGPLEVMSDRRWQTASENERMRMIDLHRPAGSFVLDGRMDPVPIDLSVLARDLPSGFDDLRDDPSRWPAAQPGLLQSSLSELLEGVGDSAVDDAAATATDDASATDDEDDVDGDEPSDTEPPASLDETMYQVEAPAAAAPSANGEHDDQHEDHGDHGDQHNDDRSDELAIDPLLQRAASQD